MQFICMNRAINKNAHDLLDLICLRLSQRHLLLSQQTAYYRSYSLSYLNKNEGRYYRRQGFNLKTLLLGILDLSSSSKEKKSITKSAFDLIRQRSIV